MATELNKIEREKLEDFKQLYRILVNSKGNNDIDDVIEALFLNVEKYYLEFKDKIPYVAAQQESYRYHLLQPINGSYPLLDFLINRAMTNAENISFGNGNAFDHAKKVDINLQRYDKYEKEYPKEFLDKQRLKSKLHETGHAIHACDNIDDNMIHPGKKGDSDYRPLSERVEIANKILGHKYSNILTVDQIRDVPEKYSLDYIIQPFGESLCSEGITEMYSVLFSGLINEHNNRKPVHIGDNYYVLAPNQFNGYAPFQRFFFHLRSNVSKDALFSSLFFGDQSALYDFAEKYQNIINKYWQDAFITQEAIKKTNEIRQKYGFAPILTTTPIQKLQALFHNASYRYVYGDGPKEETVDSQLTLDKMFLDAYKARINSGEYDPEELKKELAVATNLSTFKYNPANQITSATTVTEEYLSLYHKISAEAERDRMYRESQYSIKKENIIQDLLQNDTLHSSAMTDEEIRKAQENIGNLKK